MQSATSNCKICKGSGWVLNPDTNTASKCKCYEEIVQANRLKFAMIPEEFSDLTVKSFDTSLYSERNREIAMIAKKAVIGYINNFEKMQESGKGLFLYSKTRGSGKTRLIVSCGNALIKTHKQRVRFITTLDLLGRIRDTYNNVKNLSRDEQTYTEQQLLNEFFEIPVLILDDIGTEKNTTFVTEIFFKILDTRMTHKKITLVTSNLTIDELQHDERIKSRLRRMVISVQMPEEDIRKMLGNQENNDLINMLLGGQ